MSVNSVAQKLASHADVLRGSSAWDAKTRSLFFSDDFVSIVSLNLRNHKNVIMRRVMEDIPYN